MATAATTREQFISAIAAEMACGVEAAVERWMAEIEWVLEDNGLTTLGRLNAVREIVDDYKRLTGKKRFERGA